VLCTAHYFVCKWRLATGLFLYLSVLYFKHCGYWNLPIQLPRGLRRGFAAARLLAFRVNIPSGAWMSVSCDCCVLSGRVLCEGLITRPEESYRVWCVCGRKASTVRKPCTIRGSNAMGWRGGGIRDFRIVMDCLMIVLQYNFSEILPE
jgi:hypothetical protein